MYDYVREFIILSDTIVWSIIIIIRRGFKTHKTDRIAAKNMWIVLNWSYFEGREEEKNCSKRLHFMSILILMP